MVEKIFYELVIAGPYLMGKGFIYGLLEGSKAKGMAVFSRENKIKTETFVELVMEWTHLHESLCHLIAEESLIGLIREGIENTAESVNLTLKSVKKITKASFDFHYEVYAKKYGEEIWLIFASLPSELKISRDYNPVEEIHPEGTKLEEYAPLHPYKLQARGSVEGPLDVLLGFYKQVQEYDLIKEDPITLYFDS